MLGIDSDAPGFKKVKIIPHLGVLTHASGTIPHPNGNISVSYQLHGNKLNAVVTLPAKISGYFFWNGKRFDLKPGENSLLVAH